MVLFPLRVLLLVWVPAAVLAAPSVVEESFSTKFVPDRSSTPISLPVLVVRPDDGGRHPLALLLHGRGVSEADNLRLGRADFPANARYLAQRGYAVLIPTRIGYGITGGADLEYTGPCHHKSPLPALRHAAREMKQVLSAAQSRPWADAGRTIAIGDSFGGLIALALTADRPTGLKGVVNVSGGDGGDSLQHVDAPCDPTALETALGILGKESRVPALFLYSANDRFWGPTWPERWFAAWQAGGGGGAFERLAADKNNGHFIFNRNAEAWHGPVERFLKRLDLP